MHKSVLLSEAIEGLMIKPGGIYVDCTLGMAGHSSKILEQLNGKGFLFAFDQDESAIKFSQERLSKIGSNFKIINENFSKLSSFLPSKVDGFLFDLGVSSPQLDNAERGFSYHNDARLDMRMDNRNEKDAYMVVNNYSEKELINIFYKYGQEKYSKSIAHNIVKNRPIETTLQLAEFIKNSVPEKYRNLAHPARKVFQAIRIEVNDELEILKQTMQDAFDKLNSGGRIVVITFHSLEDKIIKDIFHHLCQNDESLKGLPYSDNNVKAKLITKKPILPSEEELQNNNRSRSAKMRIIEKL